MKIFPRIGWIGLCFLAAVFAQAEVKPHALFTDNCVLQQGIEIPIWGTANDGEKVTVELLGQKISATTTNGSWVVRLKPLKAGGPHTMTITGENVVEVKNVLVGEVWICGGQSNMQWSLAQISAPDAINAANDVQLRLISIPRQGADEPASKIAASWKECSPTTVKDFSAVGYFFGRDLRKALNVPVGLINSNVGGTPAEAWTSRGTLEADPVLRPILERHEQALKYFSAAREAYIAKKDGVLAKWKEDVEKAKAAGKTPPKRPEAPPDPGKSNHRPSNLYNAMIAPLQPFAIRGAIWYQGESNAGRPDEYRVLFPAMIRDWRKQWGYDFPFLFVQLAPFMKIEQQPTDPDWARLREAQLHTARIVPHTAMAVITDVGEENDIHPKQKEPVGARLALAARAVAYGEKIVFSGPIYDSMKMDGHRAILAFQHVGGGLVARDGDLKGFTVAGEDRNFVNAQAKIEGDKVVIWSEAVSKPSAVRYGWANYPLGNLWNKENLPATPFRTDDWPKK